MIEHLREQEKALEPIRLNRRKAEWFASLAGGLGPVDRAPHHR